LDALSTTYANYQVLSVNFSAGHWVGVAVGSTRIGCSSFMIPRNPNAGDWQLAPTQQ
jgi:hypothetical protein